MKILVFDTEHTEGVYRPWEENFVLSCLRYKFINNGCAKEKTLWFDHTNVSFIPDASVVSWKEFQSIVNESDIIVGHNVKHDIVIARYLGGISFDGKLIWDTMVADYLLHGQSNEFEYGLDAVAKRRGFDGKLKSAKEYWDSGVHTYNIPYDVLEEYVSQDVEATANIYFDQVKEAIGDKIIKVIEVQNEFIHSLSDMELNGLLIDVDKAEVIYSEAKTKVDEIEEKIKCLVGEYRINLQSNDHLSAILYGGRAVVKEKKWIIKTLKSKPESFYKEVEEEIEVTFERTFTPLKGTEHKKSGYYKSDKETIGQLKCSNSRARKLKKLLLELSTHQKFMETLRGKKDTAGFLNKIAKDGCLHTTYKNAFTTTGRLSSENPNQQNIPRDGTSPIKKIIIPRFDFIFQWDLSQIEWRAAAWLSQDGVMIHEVNSGIDQHIAACVDLMELPFIDKNDLESKQNRFWAKVFNFRQIYGGSFWGFYLDPNMPSFSKAKWRKICEDFYKKYYGLKEWQSDNIKKTWANRGLLVIPTGRRFQFSKANGRDGESYPENKIKNYPVQGISGGDILPFLTVLIRRKMIELQLKSQMILTVHDSIVFDTMESELQTLHKICKDITTKLPQYLFEFFGLNWNVCLQGEGESGRNYGEMHTLSSD